MEVGLIDRVGILVARTTGHKGAEWDCWTVITNPLLEILHDRLLVQDSDVESGRPLFCPARRHSHQKVILPNNMHVLFTVSFHSGDPYFLAAASVGTAHPAHDNRASPQRRLLALNVRRRDEFVDWMRGYAENHDDKCDEAEKLENASHLNIS